MFKFKLQQVRDYRAQLEDQAKMALARAQAELKARQKRVDDLQLELVAQMSKGYNEGIRTVDERWVQDNYIRRIKEDLEKARERLGEAELQVHHCHSDLMRKSQNRQLLDKLFEKQRDRYNHEEAQKEQYALDEIAGIRHQADAF